MRVTLETVRRQYLDQGKMAVVLIDGQTPEFCIEADTDAGYVIEALMEQRQQPDGSVAVEVVGKRKRYGVVTINYSYGPCPAP
jgi:hypothetical protein